MLNSSSLRRRRPMYVHVAAHVTASVLLAACAGTAEPSVQIDAALLEPLTALGPCGEPPTSTARADEVEGLVLPDGAIVTTVTRTDPVVTVEGWVPLTPVQLRVDYAGLDGVEVISTEDEVWEAEVLTSTGSHRMFIKAQAICADASAFVAVVAPDGDADTLPTPAGG